MNRITYFNRIISAYIKKDTSQLTFWHGEPEVNDNADYKVIGQYFQLFDYKADYDGLFDEKGVILLDYRGSIGVQYYPIAIGQYGLACYNRFKITGDKSFMDKCIIQADWLEKNLIEKNGIFLLYANFDWEYNGILKAPWPSGLAQGSALSLFLRLYNETGKEKYLIICNQLFKSIISPIKEGGVMLKENDLFWIEETLTPPHHILNGFIWSLWSVYDYMILTGDPASQEWYERFEQTLRNNLDKYDNGYWSLYEQYSTKIPMLASLFYHKLHIVQLKIMYKMTGHEIYRTVYNRWESYLNNPINRYRMLSIKTLFKLRYF